MEAAVVMAVVAILLAVAVPNYKRMQERQRMRLAAEALQKDMQLARSQSSSAGPTFLSFKRDGETWCWGINRGAACDCLRQRCNVNAQHSRDWPGIWLVYSSDAVSKPAWAARWSMARPSSRPGMGDRSAWSSMPSAAPSLCGKDAPKSAPC